MKDRSLMTTFFSGHIFDSVISYYALLNGFAEVGFLKDTPYLDLNMEDRLIIAKMGVVVLLVGAYALAKETKNRRMTFVFEKPLQIGTIAVVGVQLWNILNVVAEVVSK